MTRADTRTGAAALAAAGLLALVVVAGGCVTGRATSGGPSIDQVRNQSPTVLKARVAVARIENKVEGNMWMSFQRQIAKVMAQAQAAMAQAMRNAQQQGGGAVPVQPWLGNWSSNDPICGGVKDMLTGELVACDRFLVYERENLDEIMAEQQLSNSGAANPRARIPEGQLEGVELFIYGALTEFDAAGQGGEITVPIPAFGQTFDANIGYKRANVAMDLRIVDTRTGRIVATTTVKGSATDVKIGGQNRQDTAGLPTTLAGYKNTPVEAALRKMVKEAVKSILSKTPKDYYHYEK
jgi:curli biogenesis system outer membrane secretion channel CsgG